MNITVNSVSEKKAKALRKLRHPSRSKKFRDYMLESDDTRADARLYYSTIRGGRGLENRVSRIIQGGEDIDESETTDERNKKQTEEEMEYIYIDEEANETNEGENAQLESDKKDKSKETKITQESELGQEHDNQEEQINRELQDEELFKGIKEEEGEGAIVFKAKKFERLKAEAARRKTRKQEIASKLTEINQQISKLEKEFDILKRKINSLLPKEMDEIKSTSEKYIEVGEQIKLLYKDRDTQTEKISQFEREVEIIEQKMQDIRQSIMDDMQI